MKPVLLAVIPFLWGEDKSPDSLGLQSQGEEFGHGRERIPVCIVLTHLQWTHQVCSMSHRLHCCPQSSRMSQELPQQLQEPVNVDMQISGAGSADASVPAVRL